MMPKLSLLARPPKTTMELKKQKLEIRHKTIAALTCPTSNVSLHVNNNPQYQGPNRRARQNRNVSIAREAGTDQTIPTVVPSGTHRKRVSTRG